MQFCNRIIASETLRVLNGALQRQRGLATFYLFHFLFWGGGGRRLIFYLAAIPISRVLLLREAYR